MNNWGKKVNARKKKDTHLLIIFTTLILIAAIVSSAVSHSGVHSRNIQVDDDFDSIAEPTWELYQLTMQEGVTPTGWTIYWRGTLTNQDEKQMLSWVKEEDQFVRMEDEQQTNNQNLPIDQQTWQWEQTENGTSHQLQLFQYPHHPQQQTNFIYTWSGDQMDKEWKQDYWATEQFVAQLSKLPQIFSCLTGITNDKLNHDFADHIFQHWMEDSLGGEMTHGVSESQYVSVNGYVPRWDHHFLSAEDTKTNLQLSARYNAMDRHTHVTIGYPLILNEH